MPKSPFDAGEIAELIGRWRSCATAIDRKGVSTVRRMPAVRTERARRGAKRRKTANPSPKIDGEKTPMRQKKRCGTLMWRRAYKRTTRGGNTARPNRCPTYGRTLKRKGEKKLNEGRPTHRCAFRHRVIVRGTIEKKGSFRCGNEKTKLGNRGGGAGRGDEMANAAISMGTRRILSLWVVVVVTPRGFFADAFRPLGCGGSGKASLLYRLCRGFTQAVGTDCGCGLRIGAERGASRHTVVVVKRLHHDLWQ